MTYYLAEDSEALEHEKVLAKLKKDIIAPETNGVNWDKARHGWTRYYDDGVVTLNADLFFQAQKEGGKNKWYIVTTSLKWERYTNGKKKVGA